jgi:hypothetical protein
MTRGQNASGSHDACACEPCITNSWTTHHTIPARACGPCITWRLHVHVGLAGVGANIDAESYSKGFSGSKMDTILEKGFADMLRGTPEAKSPFPRQPCTCTTDGGEHGKDCKGRWLRTLNSQGNCFLYVHTITHEIRGSQPPGFVTSDEVDAARKQRMESALGGKWRTYASCHPEVWREAVQAAVEDGKTPLLTIEDPETCKVSAFSVPSNLILCLLGPVSLMALLPIISATRSCFLGWRAPQGMQPRSSTLDLSCCPQQSPASSSRSGSGGNGSSG